MNLLSATHAPRTDAWCRMQVPDDDPSRCRRCMRSLSQGANFNTSARPSTCSASSSTGHPDLSRILMPETWDGHPLRKDFGATGRIPGAVQHDEPRSRSEPRTRRIDPPRVRRTEGLPSPTTARRHSTRSAMSVTEERYPFATERTDVGTSRGQLHLLPRQLAVLRPVGGRGGCRSPSTDLPADEFVIDDRAMIINMGPVSTPRPTACSACMLELEGETVRRSKPDHRLPPHRHGEDGREPHVPPGVHERHPHGLRVSVLQRAGVLAWRSRNLARHRDVPPRATWIRMLMTELNRISSHLLFGGDRCGMDIGAVSMMIYGWRERESVLRFFEKVTGLRMNHNYIRPGGVAADLPDGWQRDAHRVDLDAIEASARRVRHLDERSADLARPAPWASGVISQDECHRPRHDGPDLLRSTGLQLGPAAKDMPYCWTTTSSSSTCRSASYGDCLRSLRHPAHGRDPRVDPDRAPGHRAMPDGDYRSH